MKEYIAKAVDGKDLTEEEAKKAMEIINSSKNNPDPEVFIFFIGCYSFSESGICASFPVPSEDRYSDIRLLLLQM